MPLNHIVYKTKTTGICVNFCIFLYIFFNIPSFIFWKMWNTVTKENKYPIISLIFQAFMQLKFPASVRISGDQPQSHPVICYFLCERTLPEAENECKRKPCAVTNQNPAIGFWWRIPVICCTQHLCASYSISLVPVRVPPYISCCHHATVNG